MLNRLKGKLSGLDQVAAAIVASVMLIVGLILFLLIFTPLYPYYLIPSFKPLSAAAGVLLMVCGVLIALRPPNTGIIKIAVLYAVTIAAVTNSLTGTMVLFGSRAGEGTTKTAMSSTKTQGPVHSESSHQPMNGQVEISETDTPIPISIPELYMLTGANPPKVVFESLKIRGRMVRIDSAGGNGAVSLIARPAMTCCVADAIQIYLPVRLPAETDDQLFTEGTWVSVEGTLRREELHIPDKAVKGKLQDTVIAFSAIEDSYVFEAEVVERVDAPSRVYITIFNDQQPFSY